MNTIGIQARERLKAGDKMGKTPPKKEYCCTKLQFVAEKLKQKICPFCNKKL